MATLDRPSLRGEFERLKAEFERLSAAGKMPAETRTLCNALLMLFEVLMAIFMEKTTRKGSRNSSIPPSQTDKDDSAATRPGAQGKGVKQNEARSRHSRTVTTTEVAAADACAGCGADLGDTPSRCKQRRTRIDILFEKVVHHVDAQVKDCPRCRQRTTGRFPADMPGPLQYGNGIKAYAMNLLIAQMVPLDRVCKSLKTLIDVAISPATILKFVIRLHTALERWEASAIDELLRMPALNADETSLRVDRKNHWIHVYSGGEVTVKRLHRKRGCEAIDDIGIIPRYGGVVVHDCWASYLSCDHCGHALCGSHLLRELQFVIDSNQYTWASNMKRLAPGNLRQRVGKRRQAVDRAGIPEPAQTLSKPPHAWRQGTAAHPRPDPGQTRQNRQVRCPQPLGTVAASTNQRSCGSPRNPPSPSPITGPSATFE